MAFCNTYNCLNLRYPGNDCIQIVTKKTRTLKLVVVLRVNLFSEVP